MHSLICHAIDTAVVAEQMLDRLLGPRPWQALEKALAPLGNAKAWAAFLAACHDLGKLTPSFQSRRADLARVLLGEAAAKDIGWLSQHPYAAESDTPHGVLTAVCLDRELQGWGAAKKVALTIAVALGGHHGYFPPISVVRDARHRDGHLGKETWRSWRADMLRVLARVLGLPDPNSIAWQDVKFGVDAAVALAGVTTVSDWLASDATLFPYAGVDVDLESYTAHSRSRAELAVARLNWDPWRPPADVSFRGLFQNEPRPMQQQVERLIAGQREPVLLVVEAPTGEGKTEASLQAAAALVRQLELNGVYVAMPTQATSSQAREVFKKCLVASDAARVRLVHSAAKQYSASLSGGDERPEPSEVGIDEPEGHQDIDVREWFLRQTSLLAPLGVGTVDQLLKAVIRSRHGFVRLSGLSGKVVILDEVHAYDTYMSTLIQRLVMWLGYMGVSVILLSATLPSSQRTELVQAWRTGAQGCPPDDLPKEPASVSYPRLTWAAASGSVRSVSVGTWAHNANREVRLVRCTDDGVVGRACALAGAGERCVAIVHNMVRRAVETFGRLQDEIKALPVDERPELLLIHGQLADKQRRYVEQRLKDVCGPDGDRRRLIVVGTQVLEQSLDLDFDDLITDLAPIDSLIQRWGRQHRHRRSDEDERGELVVTITGVEEGADGPQFPPHTTKVYEEAVLMRTWAVLRDRETVRCPVDVPLFIEKVYADDGVGCPAGWEHRWDKAAKQMSDTRRCHEGHAEERYLPYPEPRLSLGQLSRHPHHSGETRLKGRRRDHTR